MKELTINGIEYIRKNSIQTAQKEMPFVIVRTYSAGVFAGYLESRNGKEGIIRNSRRLWYWAGAASLSQLAVEGVSKPNECKFPCIVDRTEVTEIIEIIYCTEKSQKSILDVPVWSE